MPKFYVLVSIAALAISGSLHADWSPTRGKSIIEDLELMKAIAQNPKNLAHKDGYTLERELDDAAMACFFENDPNRKGGKRMANTDAKPTGDCEKAIEEFYRYVIRVFGPSGPAK